MTNISDRYQVQITAHHEGWMQFRLCPQNNRQMNADELRDCFSENILTFSSNGETKWPLPRKSNSGGNEWLQQTNMISLAQWH